MNAKRQFAINFVAQIAVILSQFLIGFVLTPIVLGKIGDEAYGFVGLVNNVVSYISIVTVALNSMAGRFVTVSYHAGRKAEANGYYSSVFFSNCVLAFATMLVAIVLSLNIQNVVVVSPTLTGDLKATVVITFLNASIGLISVVFGIAAFIKNELFLNSIGQLVGSLARVLLLFSLFWFAAPHMWYFSVAAIVATILTALVQFIVTRRLLPEIRLQFADFQPQKVLELVRVGAWTSLQQVNIILQTGLDLLFANWFAGGGAMGLLSIAKTVPNALTGLSANIANVFYPEMAELYAKGEKEALVRRLQFSMRFVGGFMIVPLAGFIGFGFAFYSLWLDGREISELTTIVLLSDLTIMTLLASALIEPLYYVNTLTTRIKGSVLISLGFSLAAVVIEIALLCFTELDDLVVIAGTSSILLTARHAIVQPVYCAKLLSVPVRTFFHPLVKEVVALAALCVSYSVLTSVVSIRDWVSLVVFALVAGVLGYASIALMLFTRSERKVIEATLKGRLLHNDNNQ